MPIDIIVPRLGWSMEEGTFAGWLLPHGAPVSVGQPIYSLESDKVTMDVESLDAGTLHLSADAPIAGATVVVGQLLGHLLQANEPSPREGAIDLESPDTRTLHIPPATPVGQPLPAKAASPREGAPRIMEADAVRPTEGTAVAESPDAGTLHVHSDNPVGHLLQANDASPREGTPRIMETDAVRLTEGTTVAESLDARTLHVHSDNPVGQPLPANPASPRARAAAQALGIDIATVTPREGAPRIIEADVLRHTSRTFSLHVDADATGVSGDEVFSKAVAIAVQQHPGFEAGSVAVIDLGPFGIHRFQGILNPGQKAILAVGHIAPRPVVADGQVVARLTVPLSLTVDHRVADPFAAARFLQTIVQLVEAPLALIQ